MLGKTLFVFGFSEEDAVQIITDVKYCGGTIVDETYRDEVDYIILPTSCIGRPDFQVKGRETVNCIWLETCVQDGQCYPMEYYFEPIPYDEDDPRPLEGETIVISSYSGPERNFLIAMGGMLGASVQERLVRKAAPLLVCKEPSGAKYDAAIQWDLTVVRGEWLRECARTKRRVPEGPYLVGDSICSGKNIPTGGGMMNAGCLPTTSTDDVDIESVREEPTKGPAADDVSMHPQASSTMKPLPKPSGGEFRYISEQKTRETTDLQYGFNRLSTPELRKMSSDDRMIYSQELDKYEELVVAQRTQRKPFNPNEGTNPVVTVTGTMDSPTVPRNRRLSALTGASSSRSPATPGGGAGPNTSANVTPLGTLGGEYEALSVTQRVADFETPVRETLYRALKDEEEKERNASPRTRRMKELLATPHGPAGAADGHIRTPTLPECMTKPVTPYGFRPDASPENHAFHKRKLQHWDRFHKPQPAESSGSGETASQKERRMSTPLSEIKRRFWRENFGDEYVDYIESKYTTQTNVQSLNRSAGQEEEEEEEIAGTQQAARKDPSPSAVDKGRPASSKDAAPSTSGISRSSTHDRGNISGEKRSRSELEEDDGEENDNTAGDGSNESGSLAAGQKVPDETDGPVAKKPLLTGTDDAVVKRFSDCISAARESAKKKARNYVPPEQFLSEQEIYDSEINAGVGGVIWRDRDIENVQLNKAAASPKRHAKDAVFAISGVQEDVRVALAKKIEHLKGRLASDPNRYDPACTHIVCGKPNRGEKMLSGMAAGKWILSTKYLDDSYEAGYFLDEENYEWGNPKAAKNLATLTTAGELEAATAAYTWRKRIATDGGKHDGAFTGFRVLLVAPKKEQFVRLLQSGGGTVVDCDPPFINSDRAMTATHCFVDRKMKLSSEDHRVLAEAGIAVLSIMYLNAYLTSETLPDPNNFQLPM
ncbi:AGAP002760-PA-like protein [Anopheles sinensis]|uniref:AGAP002760-PA-like protein n=1 Tax=Anopheles sinensis TaxID=74873 RepID=A0A084VTA8_ANOSI|nr:AGAP002760-PA-like protein [Anopheles sinensis]